MKSSSQSLTASSRDPDIEDFAQHLRGFLIQLVLPAPLLSPKRNVAGPTPKRPKSRNIEWPPKLPNTQPVGIYFLNAPRAHLSQPSSTPDVPSHG